MIHRNMQIIERGNNREYTNGNQETIHRNIQTF